MAVFLKAVVVSLLMGQYPQFQPGLFHCQSWQANVQLEIYKAQECHLGKDYLVIRAK